MQPMRLRNTEPPPKQVNPQWLLSSLCTGSAWHSSLLHTPPLRSLTRRFADLARRNERAQLAQILDLLAEDSQLNVYAGELERRPPGAPTNEPAEGGYGWLNCRSTLRDFGRLTAVPQTFPAKAVLGVILRALQVGRNFRSSYLKVERTGLIGIRMAPALDDQIGQENI